MRPSGVMVVALLAGCASSKWQREVVDTGGVLTTAALHVDGSHKELTIVHADPVSEQVRVLRRTGTGASWGAFTTSILAHANGRFPALSLAPDGTAWIAFVVGELKTRGDLRVAHEDPTWPGAWKVESIGEVPIVERPTIAYLPKDGGDELHVVISKQPERVLRHWTRKVNATAWTMNDLDVHEGSADPESKGLQPRLLLCGPTPSLALFYGQGDDGVPLVNRVSLDGEAYQVDGLAGEQMRFAVGVVAPPAAADAGKVALVHATCEGKPSYRVSINDIPFPEWKPPLTPKDPTDPTRTYCDPSFAHDGLGILYLAAYDMQTRAPVAFIYNPITMEWALEFVDGGPDDQGHDTATVYDPLGQEILVAYRDATNGNLELARRGVN